MRRLKYIGINGEVLFVVSFKLSITHHHQIYRMSQKHTDKLRGSYREQQKQVILVIKVHVRKQANFGSWLR